MATCAWVATATEQQEGEGLPAVSFYKLSHLYFIVYQPRPTPPLLPHFPSFELVYCYIRPLPY